MQQADYILLGGAVVPVTGPATEAIAVARAGERIGAVGSQADVLEHRGPGTEIVDLRALPSCRDSSNCTLTRNCPPSATPGSTSAASRTKVSSP